jgi:hypothetical protein
MTVKDIISLDVRDQLKVVLDPRCRPLRVRNECDPQHMPVGTDLAISENANVWIQRLIVQEKPKFIERPAAGRVENKLRRATPGDLDLV